MTSFDKNLLIKKRWLIVLTLAVLCLPWLFTQDTISILDFTDTGQIGDTIGGILSPFIAILVGYLTFEAFRMQYEANELHKEDKEAQKLKDEREQFNDRFYTMLETLRSNSESVKCSSDITGKDSFKVLVAELFVTFYAVKDAFLKYKSKATDEINDYLVTLDENSLNIMLTRMSYGLFFYGDLYYVDKDAEPCFFEVLEAIKEHIVRNGTHGEAIGYDYYLNHEIKQGQLKKLTWDLLKGHNDQLGHYFRHLYQMIKFLALADSNVINEQDKNEYARIVRAELSDFEQTLLFYNAVSDKWQSWNVPVSAVADIEASNKGLISRFRLIKNIPGNILYRGIDPWTFYKEEDKWWKEHGKCFFEQCYILTAEDEYSHN